MAGCTPGGSPGDGDPPVESVRGPPGIVRVAAQPCDRPNARLGVGVVVANGLVATAAHVVDGPNRSVLVDDGPASVVFVDPERDLALLAADNSGRQPATIESDEVVDDDAGLAVTGPSTSVPVGLLRTVTLQVDDVTAHTVTRRRAHVVAPAVDRGASGASLLDELGRVRGIVVLSNRTEDASYVVTGGELRAFLDDHASARDGETLEVAPPCA